MHEKIATCTKTTKRVIFAMNTDTLDIILSEKEGAQGCSRQYVKVTGGSIVSNYGS